MNVVVVGATAQTHAVSTTSRARAGEPPLLRAALDAHPMLRTVTVAEPLARCIAAQT